MDRAQKVALGLFIAALVVPGVDAASSLSLYWFAGATFSLLLVLSGITLGFDFITRKMKFQTRGRLVVALIMIAILLLFFAPAVQTLPSGQGSGSYCNPSGCSSVTQLKSVTEYLWCVGWEYTYSPPPASEFFFQFYAGCPPVA